MTWEPTMSEPVVRLLAERMCTFWLSPLYSESGWYGLVDGGQPFGPYPTIGQVLEQAEKMGATNCDAEPS